MWMDVDLPANNKRQVLQVSRDIKEAETCGEVRWCKIKRESSYMWVQSPSQMV
jgi:hypothetical protein